MTLKSSEVKNFSWRISTILKYVLVSSAFCHCTLPLFHQTNVEIAQNGCEDIPLFSRIQSLHRLLEVHDHDEEENSFVLTLGNRFANNLLAQHQSTFFPRCIKFLWMSWQEYVFVVLLWPLIGTQKQVHSTPTQNCRTASRRFPARCCRSPCCCSIPWPTYSSHEKFWPTNENCLWLQIQFCFPVHVSLVGS